MGVLHRSDTAELLPHRVIITAHTNSKSGNITLLLFSRSAKRLFNGALYLLLFYVIYVYVFYVFPVTHRYTLFYSNQLDVPLYSRGTVKKI